MKKSFVRLGSLAFGLSLFAVPFISFADVSITLQGADPVMVRAGNTYVDPGYSAQSTYFGDVTGDVVLGDVDTNTTGSTQETYTYGPDIFSDTASASRQVIVFSPGGGPTWCSSPFAPGWNVSLPDGGCGKTSQVVYGPSTSVHNADGSWSLVAGQPLR